MSNTPTPHSPPTPSLRPSPPPPKPFGPLRRPCQVRFHIVRLSQEHANQDVYLLLKENFSEFSLSEFFFNRRKIFPPIRGTSHLAFEERLYLKCLKLKCLVLFCFHVHEDVAKQGGFCLVVLYSCLQRSIFK